MNKNILSQVCRLMHNKCIKAGIKIEGGDTVWVDNNNRCYYCGKQFDNNLSFSLWDQNIFEHAKEHIGHLISFL